MRAAHRGALPVAVLLAALLSAAPAAAQEWRATAQVGRVTSGRAPAGNTGGSSVVLGIGRTAPRDWFGASAALPVDGDPFWVNAGGWKRLATGRTAGVLLDLSAHAFVQRYTSSEQIAPAPSPLPIPGPGPALRDVEVSGAGAGAEALAGLHAAFGPLRVEARGGAVGQRSELGGVTEARLLPTVDARVTLLHLPIVVGGETRGWWNGAERHAYAGATLRFIEGPVQLWGSAGGWLEGGVSDVVWAAGARTGIGPRLELQLAARGNGFDPVYRTASGTSVALGMSFRIGGGGGLRAPVPARYEDGQAEVRIAARTTVGRPSIAGDFTGWKPVPMERDRGSWTWRAALEPGTYHYAFVAEDGTWFVPEDTPGRRDDGMGGHVAILVVAP